VVLDYELTERPERDIEGSLYFVVTEALTNVAKYAAASQVEVRVVRADDALVLTVSDDGAGGADPGSGSGLRGLADRVAVVDGTLDITSPAGRGTTLTCRIPVPAAQLRPTGDTVGRALVAPAPIGAEG
jgi:signal transduction histidine kinase